MIIGDFDWAMNKLSTGLNLDLARIVSEEMSEVDELKRVCRKSVNLLDGAVYGDIQFTTDSVYHS